MAIRQAGSTAGFRVHHPVLREVRAMGEDIQNTGPRRPPPGLPYIKTEFDRLCDELGGPADIGVDIDKHALTPYCSEYPSKVIVPILLPYQKDEHLVRRHWPWVAFAISQYLHEKKEREKYTDEPTPEKTIELLEQIRRTTQELHSGLVQIEILSDRLTDPSAPHRRHHFAWLNAFLSQAVAGRISTEVNEDTEELLAVDFGKRALLTRLTEIVEAAELAGKAVDKNFLKRERSQTDPALPAFVFRCGKIWTSLTERKPSANKVHNDATDDPPDFVVFVQKLAETGRARPPSRKQVHSSLRKLRTPD
jgi:hypothetical protein